MAQSFTPEQAASLDQIMENLPQSTASSQLSGINATVQLRSTGVETSEWSVVIQDGQAAVNRGAAQMPDLAIEATAQVWASLLKKQLDPGWAYMSGQLKVNGDLGLAMRLQSLLSL